MKRVLIVLFSVFVTLVASAQLVTQEQTRIQELDSLLKRAKADTTRIYLYQQLCWEYKANNPDKALYNAQQALKLSVNLNDKIRVAKSFGYLAIVYKNSGQYNKALEYNLKSLKVYQEKDDKLLMSDAYNNLGNIYIIIGRNKEAIFAYNESIRYCNELGIPQEAILPLNNLGEVYRKIGDMGNATRSYNQALKLAKETKDESMIVYCMSNMGYIYEMQGNTDSALNYYHRSMEFNKKNQDLYALAYDYDFIGKAYSNSTLEDYDNALEYLDSAIEIIENIKHPHTLAELYMDKGSIYRKAENPGKAMENYRKSYDINKGLGLKIEMAKCLDSIGVVLFYNEKDISKAIAVFSEELELCQEMGDTAGLAESHYQLGCLFIELNKETNAESHLKDAEKLARIISNNNIWSKACEKLSIVYTLLNKPELSARYLEIVDSLEMSDYGKMKFKYDTAKMEKEAELQEMKLQQQKTQLYASIIIAILFSLLSLWIFNFYQQKKKANVLLSKQKDEISEKNDRLELANVEITKQKMEIEEKNKSIVDSINYAKRLQFALLPLDDDFKKILPQSFMFYYPKDIVSGDFYFLDRVGDHIFFAVADCTGHGVPGAFVSFVGHEALSHAVNDLGLTDPGKILDSVRQQVEKTFDKNEKGEVKDGMDISLGVLNTKNNTLHFAGAHHTLYLISGSGSDKTLTEIKGDRQAIGAGQGRQNFNTVQVEVKKGDLVYFTSDGYADQFGGPEGKKFKTSQFKKLLLQIAESPLDYQKQILANTYTKWKGNLEQVDDVCVMGVRIG